MISGWAFERLADQLTVLPLTPPWRAVLDAEQRMDLAAQGSRPSGDMSKDYRAISEFATVVRQRKAIVQAVLRCGAFLSGFEPQTPYRQSLSRALDVMSAGFRFSSLTGVQKSMFAFESAVRKACPDLPNRQELALESGKDRLAMESATAHLREMRDAGRKFLANSSWAAIELAAWEHAAARFDAPDVNTLAATPEEVLCHAAGRGPALAWPVLTGEASLPAWTRTLLFTSDKAPEASRARLKAHALVRLGYSAAIATLRSGLDAFVLANTPSAQLSTMRYVLQEAAKPPKNPMPGAPSALSQAVLFIRQADDSVSEEWRERPNRALVMAASVDEAANDLDRQGDKNPSLLKALGDEVCVVFETAHSPASNERLLPPTLETWCKTRTVEPADVARVASWRVRGGADLLAAYVEEQFLIKSAS